METKQSPRILISRMSAIGDSILTLPVACAIREHYPDAYIGWVIEKKAAPMVRGHQTLDAVIELERGWFTSTKKIRETKALLRPHQFDTSIDCQGLTKSALAGRLSGARQRIGFAGKHGGEISRLLNNVRVPPVFSHITDRSLELLIPLDIHSPKVQWKLPLSPASRTWAARWRRTIQSNRLTVLNPGATWASKAWEADRFAATAKFARDQYGYRSIVVWGTFEERLMAESIVEQSGGAATLAPDTDLHHLGALIETADIFISGDTGPLHIAVAVGTDTIGLYGATRPGDSGPYGQFALQKAYESGSRTHRRKADNTAMRAIEVADVCDAIHQIEAKRSMTKVA
ncbi:Lipopolysaccharide core heptosyltransferase RfaQ [Rubripirellula lacrimiformis]|uniref:Lipopolysaccharide core heptosyltransferase RfaQ n=1 Tax=Rubripirellula lacrimiformis TaxID=1930273 RepID=A0A517NFK8_9BACT|nr:glycosyltransferase family 9 protein [Rubripirellula lacrimiformis]QDT05919.1 Lipopolysaccharide core heptosyltransferase RfaQ [Rubripirellula lacrimiformis]